MCQSISIDIAFDKMIQSKVFRKQFQSSLINLLKWFWSDGRNKTKTRKDSKAILAFNAHLNRSIFLCEARTRQEKEGEQNGIIIENLLIQHVRILYSPKIILAYFSSLSISLVRLYFHGIYYIHDFH